jgi:hypothetical protein
MVRHARLMIQGVFEVGARLVIGSTYLSGLSRF